MCKHKHAIFAEAACKIGVCSFLTKYFVYIIISYDNVVSQYICLTCIFVTTNIFSITLFSTFLYIAHLYDVSSFLTDAMETLVVRPQTIDEIAEDNLKYLNLHEQKEGVRYYFIISSTTAIKKCNFFLVWKLILNETSLEHAAVHVAQYFVSSSRIKWLPREKYKKEVAYLMLSHISSLQPEPF